MNATRIELDLTPAQIQQLREIMDGLPLNRYAPLIVAVLKKLPMESDAGTPSGVGADPALVTPSRESGGFLKIGISVTDKGKAALPELARLLAQFSQGDAL